MVRTCIPDRTMQCKLSGCISECNAILCTVSSSSADTGRVSCKHLFPIHHTHLLLDQHPRHFNNLRCQRKHKCQYKYNPKRKCRHKYKHKCQYNRKHKWQYKYNRTHILHSTLRNNAVSAKQSKAKHLEVRITNGIDLHWLISINNALSGNDTRK